MNSITATYPGFQALPKGIKQMLVISESVFFDESRTPARKLPGRPQPAGKDHTPAGERSALATLWPVAAMEGATGGTQAQAA